MNLIKCLFKSIIILHHNLKLAIMTPENDYSESASAKTIEKQTAKLPSDIFLWAAIASMGASLTLKIMDRKHTALFVGQWAAPFLLLGVYNKIVKTQGHDQTSED